MIIKENGKTFEGTEPYFTRIHDENYCGKHTTYTRCVICKKLVSRQWRSIHRSVSLGRNLFILISFLIFSQLNF